MKLKVFFLGMFAAAALLSCNNELIDGPDGPKGKEVVEGLPVYASVSFKVYGTATYAGTIERPATADETTVRNAAMYVYKSTGLVPEAAVYVSSLAAHATTNEQVVTLRAFSGTKKIFIAANTANAGTTASRPNFTPTTGLEGFDLSANAATFAFDGGVNATLTTTGSAWSFTSLPITLPTSTVGSENIKADGLIESLAYGDAYGSADATGAADSYTGNNYSMLMTNWDGPVDQGYGSPAIPSYPTTSPNCEFVLVADIDSAASHDEVWAPPTSDAVNHFRIDVQRAFAKISLKITAQTAAAAPFPTFATTGKMSGEQFIAASGKGFEGVFQPWAETDGGDAIWSLGNINKETYPFQKYSLGATRLIMDPNYSCIDDSIHQFAKWVTHYDNTRIFPDTLTQYHPNPGLVTSLVKATMTTAGNSVELTEGVSAPTYFNYAYATENARNGGASVSDDFKTYVVIGGRYNPKFIVTGVDVDGFGENPKELYNGGTYTTPGAAYDVQLVDGDSVFYIPAIDLFVKGTEVLLDYYARVQTGDKDGDPYLQANIDKVAQLIADKEIILYKGGQCWYRVFIKDSDSNLEPYAVRRNHIYSVNITEFQGPGIADPNDILIPGRKDEAPTYVTAYITPLKWHEVEQDTPAPLD